MAKKLKANAVSGYSNDSNPFGDPNLTEKYLNSFPSHTDCTAIQWFFVI